MKPVYVFVFAVLQISCLTLTFLQPAVSEDTFFEDVISGEITRPKYEDDRFEDKPEDVYKEAGDEMDTQAKQSRKSLKKTLNSAFKDIKDLTEKYIEEFVEYAENSISEIIKAFNKGEDSKKEQAKQDVAVLTSEFNNKVDVIGPNIEKSFQETSQDLLENIIRIAEDYGNKLSKIPFSRRFYLKRYLDNIGKKMLKFADKSVSKFDKFVTKSVKKYYDFQTDTLKLIKGLALKFDKLVEFAADKRSDGYGEVCWDIKVTFGNLKNSNKEVDNKFDAVCNKTKEIGEDKYWDEEYRR